MRLLLSSGVVLAAGLLLGAGAPDERERSSERSVEERESSSVTPRARIPVGTPVVSTRIPSALAAGPDPLPHWLRPLPPTPRDAPIEVDPAAVHLQQLQEELEYREFYFTRAVYSGYGGGFYGRRRQSWATDFPKADRQFMVVLRRLTNLDAYPDENAVLLDDPALRRFPFLYALEVGGMDLRDSEVEGLRDYLNAGGFLMIDDFWGVRERQNFEYNIARVLPGRVIQEIPFDHALFNMVYDITEVLQVPALGRGIYGRPTWERPDATVPTVTGIFDDDGRLMVVINWNTDLGDAWEHAENPMYPVEYSTYAFQVGVNTIVYGMSH